MAGDTGAPRGSVLCTHRTTLLALVLAASLFAAMQGLLAAGQALAADSPALVQEDVVTTTAEGGGNGNGWGAHAPRITRTPGGDLYTTTFAFAGNDLNHQEWTLWKRAGGSTTWKPVTGGTIGKQGSPPQVLLAPDGTTVYVLTISAWDSAAQGAPQLWDSSTGQTTTLPGTWLEGSSLYRTGATYFGSAIAPGGELLIWEDVPCMFFVPIGGGSQPCVSSNVPGTYYWAYRDASGTWHEQQWVSSYRQAYNFLFPLTSSSLEVVGTRDLLPAETSYPEADPCREGYYCFDQALEARWTNWNVQQPPSAQVVRAASDAAGYTGNHYATVEDAYVDSAGRMHMLLSVQDAGTMGTYENHHVIVESNGQVKDVAFPAELPHANLARITQDTSGRFWIYSVAAGADGHRCTVYIAGGAGGDTDGSNLGPVSTIPFAGSYDCGTAIRNFDVNPRSGTALADYIDGAVAADYGGTWVHYRIALTGGSAAPPPTPTPVPGKGPKPPSLASSVKIASRSLCDAIAGRRYRAQLQALGGTPPYRWSMPGGSAKPPRWLSISSSGALSGTPPLAVTTMGASRSLIQVEVRGAGGRTDRRPLWLRILPPWAGSVPRC